MTEDTQDIKKRSIHRSPAYPSVDLEKAIPLIEKLNEKFSEDVFSRDNAAEELGLTKGGTAFRKIAALVHFGLISRKGNSYKVTPLAKQIIFPGDDIEIKTNAIKTAVKNPKLYKSLIISYQGKQLPTALHHRLITQENFNQLVAEKVAKDFKKSVEFAGLLKNGIMIDTASDTVISNLEDEEPTMPVGEPGASEVKTATVKQSMPAGVSISLGPDITVTFSENLKREVSRGKFAKILDDLETLGKRQNDGNSTTNAPDTLVESN